jgi:hypothetical protein
MTQIIKACKKRLIVQPQVPDLLVQSLAGDSMPSRLVCHPDQELAVPIVRREQCGGHDLCI